MRRMASWSQKIEARTFPSNFCTRKFWGGVSRYAATPMIVALSPGHSGITRFRPWSPIATGIHLNCAKKNPNLLRRLAPLTFLSPFRHFGTNFAEIFRMSKSSWMMDPTRSCEMPSCSAIDLAEIRRSSKISSWIFSMISVVVTVLCRPGWGASQVEKSPRLNCFLRWHTMVHVPLIFISEWREYPSAPCLGGKKNLMTARVLILLKSRASPDVLLFGLCNKKILAIRHMIRPFFPKTLSIPSYDIGK